MNALTQYLDPARCPWPCRLVTIASIIVIVAAIKYVVQLGFQYYQSRETGRSNK